MLLFQAHFLFEVCVTKQCSQPMSDKAGIISSPPQILFPTTQVIRVCQRVLFNLPKALFFIFNLLYFQDWRELLSKRLWIVCFCCTVIRQGWLWWWMRVIDVCVCSLRPIPGKTCAHVCEGTVSKHMRATAYHLCCKSKDCCEYIISRLPWGLSSGWV